MSRRATQPNEIGDVGYDAPRIFLPPSSRTEVEALGESAVLHGFHELGYPPGDHPFDDHHQNALGHRNYNNDNNGHPCGKA